MNYLQKYDGQSWKWHDSAEGATRFRVDGGWIYHAFGGPVFVPEFEAGELVATEHVRDDRRLKLREGYFLQFDESDNTLLRYMRDTDGDVDRAVVLEDRLARSFVAYHDDDSWSDHSTLLEAHDALIASGSESPFEVVVGVVAETKVEGGAV